MSLGVRVGGVAGFPTTWRWGYGWVMNRGYLPTFSKLEQALINGGSELND